MPEVRIDVMFPKLFRKHPLIHMAWLDYLTSWDASRAKDAYYEVGFDENYVGITPVVRSVQTLIDKYIFPSPEELGSLFELLVDILAWAERVDSACFNGEQFEEFNGMKQEDREGFPQIFNPDDGTFGKLMGEITGSLKKGLGLHEAPKYTTFEQLQAQGVPLFNQQVVLDNENTSVYDSAKAKRLLGDLRDGWLSSSEVGKEAGVFSILMDQITGLFMWFDGEGVTNQMPLLRECWKQAQFNEVTWFDRDRTAPEHFLTGGPNSFVTRLTGKKVNIKDSVLRDWFTDPDIRRSQLGRSGFDIEHFAMAGFRTSTYVRVAAMELGEIKKRGSLTGGHGKPANSLLEEMFLNPKSKELGMNDWKKIEGSWDARETDLEIPAETATYIWQTFKKIGAQEGGPPVRKRPAGGRSRSREDTSRGTSRSPSPVVYPERYGHGRYGPTRTIQKKGVYPDDPVVYPEGYEHGRYGPARTIQKKGVFHPDRPGTFPSSWPYGNFPKTLGPDGKPAPKLTTATYRDVMSITTKEAIEKEETENWTTWILWLGLAGIAWIASGS